MPSKKSVVIAIKYTIKQGKKKSGFKSSIRENKIAKMIREKVKKLTNTFQNIYNSFNFMYIYFADF